MQIERKSEWYRTEAMRRFEVKDAPPVEAHHRHYRSPVTWTPEKVVIYWTDGAMVRVGLSGRGLKKDGSIGSRELDSVWHHDGNGWYPGFAGAGQVDEMPPWLAQMLVGQQEPTPESAK